MLLSERPQHGWISLRPKINIVRSKQAQRVQRSKRSERQHPSCLVLPFLWSLEHLWETSGSVVKVCKKAGWHGDNLSKNDAFRKRGPELLALYLIWKEWWIRCGWLLILPYSPPPFIPYSLSAFCWSDSMFSSVSRKTLKVFAASCLSSDTSRPAPPVSTSMCARPSVALEQLAFEIQYEPPGRELLRNSQAWICNKQPHTHEWTI